MKLETRKLKTIPDTSNNRLSGVALPFGEVAEITPNHFETILQGAFTKAIAANDILCLVDHDDSKLLGRTKSKTLSLKEDTQGLLYDILLPDTTTGRDVLELAHRGDLGGVSVGFYILKQEQKGQVTRIIEADLIEISIISSFPAYAQTTIAARSRKQRLMNYLRWAAYV